MSRALTTDDRAPVRAGVGPQSAHAPAHATHRRRQPTPPIGETGADGLLAAAYCGDGRATPGDAPAHATHRRRMRTPPIPEPGADGSLATAYRGDGRAAPGDAPTPSGAPLPETTPGPLPGRHPAHATGRRGQRGGGA